ncbi:hypothetical protein MLD38_007554 [Melastoma candidum]|uniref:Uncharacterized protein n=1 Tax=Melastoma candidum TaxID=119954 RepID=A0ACB9RS16_9MYRT|nr:hypothetical protein MLD38_007554 [Melastoma candidum]
MALSRTSLPNPNTRVSHGRSSHPWGRIISCPSPIKPCHLFFIQASTSDEAGKPVGKMVDNNMAVLRRRIRQLQLKEGSASSSPLEPGGPDWTHEVRRRRRSRSSSKGVVSSVVEMVVVASSAVGLVILGGSFCIFLVSLVVAWMDNNKYNSS